MALSARILFYAILMLCGYFPIPMKLNIYKYYYFVIFTTILFNLLIDDIQIHSVRKMVLFQLKKKKVPYFCHGCQ